MKPSASHIRPSRRDASRPVPSPGMAGLGALLVASSLLLPACAPGQPDQPADDADQTSVRIDDSGGGASTTESSGDTESGDYGIEIEDGAELESGITIRETPVEYLTEEDYAGLLSAYDAAYKDGEGRYKGIWYACSVPQGYAVPAYKMQQLESEEDLVNGVPNDFVANDSPNRLSVRRLSNGMVDGAEDHGSINLQCRLGTYEELVARNPRYYEAYQEGAAYVAATGVSYRILASSDSTIAFPQVGGSVASTPFVTFSHVPEGTVHEFLDGLQVVADPGAAQSAYFEEHGIVSD